VASIRRWKSIDKLVSSLGLVLRYYSRVFGRAVHNTVTLIGWQWKSLIFPIAYLLGFLWFVRSRGFLLAFQALLEDWYLFFVPAGLGVALIFIYNLLMAPVRLSKEQEEEINRLRGSPASLGVNSREVVGQALADLDDLFLRSVTTDQELETWTNEVDVVVNTVLAFIHQAITPADARLVRSVSLSAMSYGHAHNSAHNSRLAFIDAFRRNLRELLVRLAR
jgi:hypothetical protein